MPPAPASPRTSSSGPGPSSANFAFLAANAPLLAHLGALAERHAFTDPNSSLFKVRQLGEALL